jgi:beta-phosphoglucomutase-like phosphatase (HAD superfamily)
MLKVILWDNDGLLVDTEELYFSVTREVLSEVGIDLTLEMFIEISLTRGQSAFDLAVDQGFDQETIFKLRGDRNRRYKERLMDGVRLLDGVEETLSELHGKVIMGIVTGSRREHFDSDFQKHQGGGRGSAKAASTSLLKATAVKKESKEVDEKRLSKLG